MQILFRKIKIQMFLFCFLSSGAVIFISITEKSTSAKYTKNDAQSLWKLANSDRKGKDRHCKDNCGGLPKMWDVFLSHYFPQCTPFVNIPYYRSTLIFFDSTQIRNAVSCRVIIWILMWSCLLSPFAISPVEWNLLCLSDLKVILIVNGRSRCLWIWTGPTNQNLCPWIQ